MKQDFTTLYDSCLSNEKPTAEAIETFGAQVKTLFICSGNSIKKKKILFQ